MCIRDRLLDERLRNLETMLRKSKDREKELLGNLDEALGKLKRITELEEEVKILRKDNELLKEQVEVSAPLYQAIGGIVHNEMARLYDDLETHESKMGEMKIEAEELKVLVTHKEEVKPFSTKTGMGKIMYVIVYDLKGGPASENQISEALIEHGWNIGHSTLAPNLSQLCKQGVLVKIDTKPTQYKTPMKVKIEVKSFD